MQDVLVGIRTYLVENNLEECEEQVSEIRRAFPEARLLLVNCGLDPTKRMTASVDEAITYSPRPTGLGEPTKMILDYAREKGFKELVVIDGDQQHYAEEIARLAREERGRADAVVPERKKRFLFARGRLDGKTIEDLMNAFLRSGVKGGTTIPDLTPGAYVIYQPSKLHGKNLTAENSWVGDLLLVQEMLEKKMKIASPRIGVRPNVYAISSENLVFKAIEQMERFYAAKLDEIASKVKENPYDYLYGGNLGLIDDVLDAYRDYQYKKKIVKMKALVLAGGKGTRFKPFTNTIQKQVFPLANKPLLHFIMEKIARTGITEVGVIVGPNKDQIRDCLKDGSNWNLNVTYIEQDNPAGLAHAVLCAKQFLGESPFLMYLGDNLLHEDVTNFLLDFLNSKAAASIMLARVKEPQKFGIAELDENGRIKRLLEKPKNPPTNLAIIGVYAFHNEVFNAISRIKPSARGELEITDAIQKLLEAGRPVDYRVISDWWEDTGNSASMLDANARLLDELKDAGSDAHEKQVDATSVVKGRVSLGAGAAIRNGSTVIGPAAIGENCIIDGSFIGPYTTLGNNNKVSSSQITYSLTLDNVVLENAKQLVFSIIGKNSRVTGTGKHEENAVLMIGDDTQIKMT